MLRALCILALVAIRHGEDAPAAAASGAEALAADAAADGAGPNDTGNGSSHTHHHHPTVIKNPTRPSPWREAGTSDSAAEVESECANASCDANIGHEEVARHEAADLEAADLEERLLKPGKYNYRRLPPRRPGKPVVVTLDIRIERIGPLVDQSYKVDLYFVQAWKDQRLSWQAGKVGLLNFLKQEDIDQVWTPGTVFFHADPIEKRPVQRLTVFSTGNVEYTQHFLMTVRCVNKEFAFPFDINYCTLRCGSYIWNKTEVEYVWKDRGLTDFFANGAWEFNEHRFQNGSLRYDVWEGTGGSIHRHMVAYFQMSRTIGRYVWNVYLPVFCLAFIAYCSYWIGPYAAPARATIGVITVLTCTVQLNHTQQNDGAMQLTALDLYVLFALMFCILAMAEYALVNFFLSIAFGMNPPKSELGMRHKHVRAKWRLSQLMMMREEAGRTRSARRGLANSGGRNRDAHLNQVVQFWLGVPSRPRSRDRSREHSRVPDDSDDDSFSDSLDDQPFEEEELKDFFAAADRSLKESVSFEDVLSAVELLALEEVPEDELRRQFDAAASSGSKMKRHHQQGELNYDQFGAFVADATARQYQNARGPHLPVAQHPSLVLFRRTVTWRLDDEPTLVDAWMRLVTLPILLIWNVAYAWVWQSRDPVASAARAWLIDSMAHPAHEFSWSDMT